MNTTSVKKMAEKKDSIKIKILMNEETLLYFQVSSGIIQIIGIGKYQVVGGTLLHFICMW